MATYTPKVLIGPAQAVTSTPASYTSPASTFAILRTISAVASTTAITLTVSLGADAAGTRIINAQPLTQNQVYVLNGWWITSMNSANAINATSNATGTQCIGHIAGYEYT